LRIRAAEGHWAWIAFATPRLLRDAHLGSIWEGTGNIVALDALGRAVGRHGAEAALAAHLHARLTRPRRCPPSIGLEVDDEFEPRRLLDGEVAGLGTLENPVLVARDAPVRSP
jgi:hypothetical protein